jgi:hypothetical protein
MKVNRKNIKEQGAWSVEHGDIQHGAWSVEHGAAPSSLVIALSSLLSAPCSVLSTLSYFPPFHRTFPLT